MTLVNDGKVGHSIDFHASQTNMDQDMRTIQPGESLVYQFKRSTRDLDVPLRTPPILHHIGNGMYGAVIIDPPDLAPVDHELVMVQSELYLGPQGQPGDLTKMLHDQYDAVVFKRLLQPVQVRPDHQHQGRRAGSHLGARRGPSDLSSFHIVGTIFDTVFKEGAYLVRPGNAESGGRRRSISRPHKRVSSS